MYQPNTPGLLHFACPHAQPPPVELHPEGGQIAMPKNCQGILDQIQIPAFSDAETHYVLPEEHHMALPRFNASFWITETSLGPVENHAQVLKKITNALTKSRHMTMPLNQFKKTLEGIQNDLNQDAITHFMKHNTAAPHAGTVVTILILASLTVMCCCMGKCCWRRYSQRRQQQVLPQVMPMVTFAPPTQTVTLPQIASSAIQEYRDTHPTPMTDSPATPEITRRTRSRTRRTRSSQRTN